jgi:hypothetical protein
VKSGEPVFAEPFGPLADVPRAQAAESGGLLQGLAPFEQEQDPAPACQPGVASRRALPVLDLGAVFWGQDDGQGGFAAPHGNPEVSGCVIKRREPTGRHDRQDRRELSIRYPFFAALYLEALPKPRKRLVFQQIPEVLAELLKDISTAIWAVPL